MAFPENLNPLYKLATSSALLHERSYPRVGFFPFFSPSGKSQICFPLAFVSISGDGKGLIAVIGRVRFLMILIFLVVGSLLE
jgi:hypothetical protein